MRSTIVLVITTLILLSLCNPLSAQSLSGKSWQTFLHFSGGYFLADNYWEISHPYYNPSGGATWETITGEIAVGGSGSCGIEFKKKYFGIQADLGFLPMRFRVDPSPQYVDLKVYITELLVFVYPAGNRTKKILSFLAFGGGLFFTDSDAIKRGYLLSGKIGLRYFMSEKLGISISIASKYLKHHQAQIQDQIQKDLNMTSAVISADLIYGI